jgi:ribosome-associated translation inhibitor RaiA
MQIQINSDKNIDITIDSKQDYKAKTEKKLDRFESIISRIEVHLSDENSEKSGLNDKKCLIEARMLNRQPIIVTDTSDVIEKSFSSALNKLRRKLDSIVGKMRDQ